MQQIEQKKRFLKEEYVRLLRQLPADSARRWGKMNLQQMVEHMSASVRVANGRDPHQLVTPAENIPKMQAFLMSEKQFRENTSNVLMPEEPVPARQPDIAAALDELQEEIDELFSAFQDQEDKTVTNPFFGNLNFNMWVQLLHKHAWHHLRQFGVEQPVSAS